MSHNLCLLQTILFLQILQLLSPAWKKVLLFFYFLAPLDFIPKHDTSGCASSQAALCLQPRSFITNIISLEKNSHLSSMSSQNSFLSHLISSLEALEDYLDC